VNKSCEGQNMQDKEENKTQTINLIDGLDLNLDHSVQALLAPVYEALF